MKQKAMVGLLLIILLSVTAYFTQSYWSAYQSIINPRGADQLTEQELERNKIRIKNALRAENIVSESEVVRGFWYTYVDEYGNEHVYRFDVDMLSGLAISDKDLRAYIERLRQSEIVGVDAIREARREELPETMQFHNAVYGSEEGAESIQLKALLEGRIATGEYTVKDLEKLIYLYELEGLYSKRDTIEERLCTEFSVRCDSGIDVVLQGIVVDGFGDPIQGVVVEALTRSSTPVITDAEGRYTLPLRVQKMEKIRLKGTKRNYSDGVVSTLAITENKKIYTMDTITLTSPISIVTIDTEKKTVTGSGNTYAQGVFTITTEQSTYRIPEHAIVHADGSAYTGVIDVYLYEFTKEDVPESLIAIDTFDAVRGYAGNLMKTFGMPYIQFFTPEGEELHVLKSNPMNLSYTIYHMEALYNNEDQIYEALTVADMEFLARASEGSGYPIDRSFLIQNDLVRFPAFWVFDRTRGVWENVGIRVTDPSGIIETVFYTLNDD